MSERGYFSYRWAIPGYTFLLLFVLINHVPLLGYLAGVKAPQVLGAFLAFLSLLGSSAMGFLISQIWWWRFDKNGVLSGMKELRKVEKATENMLEQMEFKIPKFACVQEKKRILWAIADFSLYVKVPKEDKERLSFVWRRWDIYHLLSSTHNALLLGLTVGSGWRCALAYVNPFQPLESANLIAIT